MRHRLRYPSCGDRCRSWNAPWTGWLITVGVGATLIVSDLLEGPDTQWTGALTVVPFVAAGLLSPLSTALAGFLVVVALICVMPLQGETPGDLHEWPAQLRLLLVAGAALGAVLTAVYRERSAVRTQQLSLLAASTQDALMRPIPPVLGNLRCTTRYQSALEHARVGGDIVEVMRTDHGIRVIVGDVQGKGLAAIRLAGMVLGSFRELAFTTPGLGDLAGSLSRSVARVSRPEEFVTAALLQIDDGGGVQMVLAGHPAPFRVRLGRPGGVDQLGGENDPPLGIAVGEPFQVHTTALTHGERLVLVTDGLLEARRPRRWWMRGPLARPRAFFPAEEAIAQELSHGASHEGLDRVLDRADAWTGYRRDDDRALLVLEPLVAADPPGAREPVTTALA